MYIERVENSKQCKNQDESQQNLFSGGDESKQISASKRKVLKIIKEGECFGTHSFVTGREKVMNVMSTKFTELIKIRREKFISIVKENKQDFEKFMDLRDKVIFDKNYRKADGIKCHACHSQDHVYTDCNKVQFDKNNLFVIFRYNKSIDQKRVVTSRKNYLKINARSQFQIINKKASSYQAINDLIGSSEEFSENSQNESQEVDDNEDEDEQEESQQTNQEENNLQQNQTFQQHYDFTEHDSISDMAKNTSHIPKIKTAISLEKRGEQISAKKSLSIRGSHDFSGIEPSITSHYQSNITSVDKLENENVLNQTEQNCHSPLSPMKVKLVIQFSKQYKSDQNLFNSIINLRKNSSKYLQRIVKLLILSFYYIPKVLFSILKSFLTKNSLYAHSPKIQKVQKQPDLEEFMLSSNTQKIPSSFGIGGKAQQVLVPTQVSFGRPQTTKHSKFDSSAVIQYEGISRHNTTRNRRYSGVSATVQTFLEGEFFFWKFDQLQDFQFYYPYFNHGNILKRLNQMYYQRIMKKKKQVKKQSVKLISQTGI